MPDIIDTSPEKALTDKQLQQALLDEQALIAKESQIWMSHRFLIILTPRFYIYQEASVEYGTPHSLSS